MTTVVATVVALLGYAALAAAAPVRHTQGTDTEET